MKKSYFFFFILFIFLTMVFFFSRYETIWYFYPRVYQTDQSKLLFAGKDFLEKSGLDLTGFKGRVILSVDERILKFLVNLYGYQPSKIRLWFQKDNPPVYLWKAVFKKKGSITSYKVYFSPQTLKVVGFDFFSPQFSKGSFTFEVNSFDESGFKIISQLRREDEEVIIKECALDLIPAGYLYVRRKIRKLEGKVVSNYPYFYLSAKGEKWWRIYKLRTAKKLYAIFIIGFTFFLLGGLYIFVLKYNFREFPFKKIFYFVILLFILELLVSFLNDKKIFFNWPPLWNYYFYYFYYFYYVVTSILTSLWLYMIIFILLFSGYWLERKNGIFLLEGVRINISEIIWSLGVATFSGILMYLFLKGVSYFYPLRYDLYPQGYFMVPFNSTYPLLLNFFFFLKIAIVEEIGYRFFAFHLVYYFTRKKFLSSLIVAIFFGLAHAEFSFLPPAHPEILKVFLMTVIGLFWQFVALKRGIISVIGGHFLSDFIIFSYPFIRF